MMDKSKMVEHLRAAYRIRCQQVYPNETPTRIEKRVEEMPMQPWWAIEANFARMPWWYSEAERYRQAAQISIVEPTVPAISDRSPAQQKLDDARLAIFLAHEAVPGDDD